MILQIVEQTSEPMGGSFRDCLSAAAVDFVSSLT